MATDPGAAGHEPANVTQADIQAFTDKLDAWGKGLTPQEQALLAILISRAESGDEGDVQGFNMPSIRDATSGIFGSLVRGPTQASYVQVAGEWYRVLRPL